MRPLSRASVFRSTLPWVVAAFAACGPPESFDYITGTPPLDAGPEIVVTPPEPRVSDPLLKPPRQRSPISGSWVNTTRPRFRWDLLPNTTGARLQLCRTRARDSERVSIDIEGPETTLDTELAPGLWSWSLASTTSALVGETFGYSWEIFVRGPAAGGRNDTTAPSGSIVDINGDGLPDILIAFETAFGPDSFNEIIVFYGSVDPTLFTFGLPDGKGLSMSVSSTDAKVGALDTDGDGFTDVAMMFGGTPTRQEIAVVPGSPDGMNHDDVRSVLAPQINESPNLREAGDMDGDGWGDLAVTTKTTGFLLFGTATGLGPVQDFFFTGPLPDGGIDGGQPPPKAALAVAGAFSRDNDDHSDIVLAEVIAQSPVFYFLGGPQRGFLPISFDFNEQNLPSRALALTTGDFDGDGLGDTAFTADRGGKLDLCTISGAAPEVLRGADIRCWASTPKVPGFGSSLATADIDLDGRDEILVGSPSSGIWIIRQNGIDFAADHLDTPFGATLTVVTPGRPSPAIWAATRADGTEVGIFRGNAIAKTLAGSSFQAKKMGPTIR